jgi:peptidylprolyl isomerase
VTITHVDNNMIVLNANHPLAGKDLTFEIEVVSVK